MRSVPTDLAKNYSNLLGNKGIPPKNHYHFQKWLRYYLDFCHKQWSVLLTPKNLKHATSGRLDSVPVGDPQTMGTPENLLLWLQKQRYQRYRKCTPWQVNFQSKSVPENAKCDSFTLPMRFGRWRPNWYVWTLGHQIMAHKLKWVQEEVKKWQEQRTGDSMRPANRKPG